MFCPQCQLEYRQGFTRCSDCEVDLVHALPESNPVAVKAVRKGLLVQLWTGDDLPLHDALLEDLEAAGIPFLDRPAEGYSGSRRPLLEGIAPSAVFGFEVQVFSSDLDVARQILQRLTEGQD
jgi:hypothetical protein